MIRWISPLLVVCISTLVVEGAVAAEKDVNVAQNSPGELPLAEDGRKLNLDFEKGTLDDWTAEGEAFKDQPIKGPIDPKRPFGADKRSNHTGDFWIGGYEKLRDEPVGTLISVPFKVTQRYASFLLGGGKHKETRVELVKDDGKKVFFTAVGQDDETLKPVVVDLKDVQDQKIFIRLVDKVTGGWGHVNFDDFRFHKVEPKFSTAVISPTPPAEQLYPFAGLEPEAAAKAMVLPTGFRVQVAAAEPDIKQPIAMAFDHRGRLWVAEAYEYPRKAPEGRGKDRILILEDTDGDGKFDKFKVFAEQLNLVSGMELGFGGVYVGAAPQLLFIPDRDGDDVPDGPAEVLLDGWAYEDTHETLNTFKWGPDGWLYGCHGVFTHSKVGKPGTPGDKRIPLNAGIWRYHPTQHRFEVFAEGTSNPWGVDFNDRGQAFCTACVIPHLFHIIQGARYERQAGSHFNPHTYNDIKTIADHRHYTGNQWDVANRRQSDELGGGHAHAGAMIYLGGSWPEQYRDQIFMNNIHGNRINQDRLAPRGSGYVGSHGPDFILTKDQWSQILNLQYGPDGQVLMIDWYDKNQCHHNDTAAHDRANGRIFRVSYDNAKPVKVDMSKKEDAALFIEDLTNTNEWYTRHARRLMQERAASGKLNPEIRGSLTSFALTHKDESRRLRGLWALHVTGGVPAEVTVKLLADKSPYVRGWAIQLATEDPAKPPAMDLLERFAEMARKDDSPVVRLYLASALQRLPLESRWSILEGLTSHPADAVDQNLPLMYWYAAEPLASVNPKRALALTLAAGDKYSQLAGFMIRRIGAGTAGKSLVLLVEGLTDAKDEATELIFLRGLNESLKATRQATAPPGWDAVYKRLSGSPRADLRLQAAALAATFGNAGGTDELRKLTTDANSAAPIRREALNFLVKAKDVKLPALLHGLLKDAALRGDALRALAVVDDPGTPAAILAAYEKLAPAERRDALGTLGARVTYAQALLAAIDKKQIAAGELTADLIRQLRNLNDADLNKRIEQVWGTIRESAADKAQLIAYYKNLLAPAAGEPADVELGRAMYAKTCQQCHTMFGIGGKVGPSLTGSNRANLDYIVSNIVDPSAILAKEYQPTVLRLSDGRVITGIVRPTETTAVQVQTANELILVPKDDIEEQKLSDKSMMPDDQLKPMSSHEVRSLIAYMATPFQTPMLANVENAKTFFNGKDLAGWRGDEKVWSVEKGEMIGNSGAKEAKLLINDLAIEDFRLTLDAKVLGGNCDIVIRGRPDGDLMLGDRVGIGSGALGWGVLHGHRDVTKTVTVPVQANDWNKVEIVAVGCRIRVWINGTQSADVEHPQQPLRGNIALLLVGGGSSQVHFRNLELKSLSRPIPPGSAFPTSFGGPAKGTIRFKKQVLDTKFRSEGVAYGDFNHDGRLDIAAGSVWFEAPDWKMHALLEKPKEFNIKTYGDTFCNWAEDLNGDGRQDLVVVDFPGKPTWWFENPGSAGGIWKKHQITPVTNNESPAYADLFGDGRRRLICGYEGQRMGAAKPGLGPDDIWPMTSLSLPKSPSTDPFSHGLGIGDINGDGRADVVVPQGWWEQPEPGIPSKGAIEPWKFHPANLGQPAAHMFVYDFNGDGRADILSSSPHGVGIWWHEQTADGWKTHEIEKKIAQSHALRLADINGDGLPDFVTGKRYYAHNGRDPGEDEPPLLCWYEFSRQEGRPHWTPHVIDDDSGVGTQFEVVDLNGDGLLDVIVSNKKGTFYFEQARSP